MADEEKTEMVEEKKEEAKVEVKADTKTDPNAEVQAELERTRQALKEANKEAATRRKRLEELEKAEADRKAAEMTETEKAQARIKELEAQKAEYESKIKQQERRELQRKVAKAVGLPDGLAERLQGETEEDMTTDAKSVLELLPKQETPVKPKTPTLNPTNPGDGEKVETHAERKARLGLGSTVNTFDPAFARKHGGGVTVSDKE